MFLQCLKSTLKSLVLKVKNSLNFRAKNCKLQNILCLFFSLKHFCSDFQRLNLNVHCRSYAVVRNIIECGLASLVHIFYLVWMEPQGVDTACMTRVLQ